MNALRMLVAGVAVCALASGVTAEEKKADNAKLLMGSWEAIKADPGTLPVGAVVTFKEGKMTVTEKKDGKDETHEATYKVEGDKLMITMKMGDNTATFTITLKKLSATEMVGANDEGKVVEFKRKK
jgi:uncharacterized protein (TIGR03066 family)